ncbi:MAG: hypothetical protein QM731_11960 [Chitinophagaceae bacterium]
MKPFITRIILALFLLIAAFSTTSAQTPDTVVVKTNDTTTAQITPITSTPPDDGDFTPFLLLFGITVLSFVFGAVAIGAFAAAFVLFTIVAMTGAGILSTSIIVGIYKRSFAAGFKTFLVITCSIGGVVAGAATFWLIARLLHLQVSTVTMVTAGALSGFTGGILLALSLYKIIRVLSTYGKNKLIAH